MRRCISRRVLRAALGGVAAAAVAPRMPPPVLTAPRSCASSTATAAWAAAVRRAADHRQPSATNVSSSTGASEDGGGWFGSTARENTTPAFALDDAELSRLAAGVAATPSSVAPGTIRRLLDAVADSIMASSSGDGGPPPAVRLRRLAALLPAVAALRAAPSSDDAGDGAGVVAAWRSVCAERLAHTSPAFAAALAACATPPPSVSLAAERAPVDAASAPLLAACAAVVVALEALDSTDTFKGATADPAALAASALAAVAAVAAVANALAAVEAARGGRFAAAVSRASFAAAQLQVRHAEVVACAPLAVRAWQLCHGRAVAAANAAANRSDNCSDALEEAATNDTTNTGASGNAWRPLALAAVVGRLLTRCQAVHLCDVATLASVDGNTAVGAEEHPVVESASAAPAAASARSFAAFVPAPAVIERLADSCAAAVADALSAGGAATAAAVAASPADASLLVDAAFAASALPPAVAAAIAAPAAAAAEWLPTPQVSALLAVLARAAWAADADAANDAVAGSEGDGDAAAARLRRARARTAASDVAAAAVHAAARRLDAWDARTATTAGTAGGDSWAALPAASAVPASTTPSTSSAVALCDDSGGNDSGGSDAEAALSRLLEADTATTDARSVPLLLGDVASWADSFATLRCTDAAVWRRVARFVERFLALAPRTPTRSGGSAAAVSDAEFRALGRIVFALRRAALAAGGGLRSDAAAATGGAVPALPVPSLPPIAAAYEAATNACVAAGLLQEAPPLHDALPRRGSPGGGRRLGKPRAR